MEKSKEEINNYLSSNGWTGNGLGWLDHYEQRMWNSHENDALAFEWFKKRRRQLFESIKSEFDSRHSAMTPEGAKGYADNWN